MTTAFVLSGGGSLGSVQVGMLLALAEQDIRPDLLVGTSVGALNAAWVAGRPGLSGAEDLASLWRSINRKDVFPADPLVGLLGFLGRTDHIVPAGKLRSLLQRHLGYTRLEDAPTPIAVVTTEITTGIEVVLTQGDTVDAVAASAAIPGVFPHVTIDGHHLVDGGVSNNAPISHAVAAGATDVYVLPTGYACALDRPPRAALAMALHSITLTIQQRLIADVARYQDTCELHVLPPLCPLSVSPLDFSRTADLIARAHEGTARWLKREHHLDDQTRLLALHRHDPVGRPMHT